MNPLDERATDLTAQPVEAATLKAHHESVIEGMTKDAETASAQHNQMKARLLAENALLIRRKKSLTGELMNERPARPALFSSQTQCN